MSGRVIVLNGASSSGKTTLGRSLQAVLPDPWLLLGIDDLIRAMPDEGLEDGTLLGIDGTGQVHLGPGWQQLETSWYRGIAAMVATGANVIVDDVFLGGGESQRRLRAAFGDLEVLWVGVTCDLDVARAREAARPDRVSGMSAAQAARVHEGVAYDLTIDTSDATPASCAASIASRL
ncbi:MAG TPA: AAA family ATPase [Acidimicrobiales bacterium]|nr:AAA family ATPase [Acidimicrobiales bacterium]